MADIPREYWGKSSRAYGQVSETGQTEVTPKQIKLVNEAEERARKSGKKTNILIPSSGGSSGGSYSKSGKFTPNPRTPGPTTSPTPAPSPATVPDKPELFKKETLSDGTIVKTFYDKQGRATKTQYWRPEGLTQGALRSQPGSADQLTATQGYKITEVNQGGGKKTGFGVLTKISKYLQGKQAKETEPELERLKRQWQSSFLPEINHQDPGNVTVEDRRFIPGVKSAVTTEIKTIFNNPMDSQAVKVGSKAGVYALANVFSNVLIAQPHPAGKVAGISMKALLGTMLAVDFGQSAKTLASNWNEYDPFEKGNVVGNVALGGIYAYGSAKVTTSLGTHATKPFVTSTKKVGTADVELEYYIDKQGEVSARPFAEDPAKKIYGDGDADIPPGAITVGRPVGSVRAIEVGTGSGGTNSLFSEIKSPLRGMFTKQRGSRYIETEVSISALPAGTVLKTAEVTLPILMTQVGSVSQGAGLAGLAGLTAVKIPTAIKQLLSTSATVGSGTAIGSRVGLLETTKVKEKLSLKTAQKTAVGTRQEHQQRVNIGTNVGVKLNVGEGVKEGLKQIQGGKTPLRTIDKFKWNYGGMRWEPRPVRKETKISLLKFSMPKPKYSPSLLGSILNIKGKKPGLLTGIEIRPILIPGMKRKRKR